VDPAKIFRNYCAACHGVNGHEDCPAALALKTKLPELYYDHPARDLRCDGSSNART